eukprot:1157256-Pelagomonas_calceolata.AAC.7
MFQNMQTCKLRFPRALSEACSAGQALKDSDLWLRLVSFHICVGGKCAGSPKQRCRDTMAGAHAAILGVKT